MDYQVATGARCCVERPCRGTDGTLTLEDHFCRVRNSVAYPSAVNWSLNEEVARPWPMQGADVATVYHRPLSDHSL